MAGKPLRLAWKGQVFEGKNTRVVDQHIQPIKLRPQLVCRPLDFLDVGQIALNELRPPRAVVECDAPGTKPLLFRVGVLARRAADDVYFGDLMQEQLGAHFFSALCQL